MKLATNLNLDLHWLHPTAWVYWQIIDGGGWGLLDGDNGKVHIGKANAKYFVLAQYSRHIRPGMMIIDGGADKNTVAAYSSAQSKLVIITTNYGNAQQITYDLSKFSTVAGP